MKSCGIYKRPHDSQGKHSSLHYFHISQTGTRTAVCIEGQRTARAAHGNNNEEAVLELAFQVDAIPMRETGSATRPTAQPRERTCLMATAAIGERNAKRGLTATNMNNGDCRTNIIT